MNIKLYKTVQNAAKVVHANLSGFTDSQSTEKTIVDAAVELLRQQGITDTWYHGVPAFVLVISGIALRQIIQKGVSLTKTVLKRLGALVFLPLSHIFEDKVKIGGLSMKIYTILMVTTVQLSFNKSSLSDATRYSLKR